MKRIGSTASGGTIDMTVMNGESVALASGNDPVAMAATSAIAALATSPMPSLRKLDAVSVQSRYSPVRLSSVKAADFIASLICVALGNSLSSGLSASRIEEPVKYTASSTTNGSSNSISAPVLLGCRLMSRMLTAM